MPLADIHQLADTLYVIEGRHPHALWSDPDIPSIVLYRCDDTLYILDTGLGVEVRAAIVEVAGRLGTVDQVMVLNSHGHGDHLGNNDVLAAIPARRRAHYITRASRPMLDFATFFRTAFQRGIGYFDYLSGLSFTTEAMSSLLAALHYDATASSADLSALGDRLRELQLLPVLSRFVPGAVIDIVVSTYGPSATGPCTC